MVESLLERPGPDETGVARSGDVRIAWRRYGDGPETILFVPEPPTNARRGLREGRRGVDPVRGTRAARWPWASARHHPARRRQPDPPSSSFHRADSLLEDYSPVAGAS